MMTYCGAVNNSAWEQKPGAFAELSKDSPTERRDERWAEFASKKIGAQPVSRLQMPKAKEKRKSR